MYYAQFADAMKKETFIQLQNKSNARTSYNGFCIAFSAAGKLQQEMVLQLYKTVIPFEQ
jgi:hypothetical protein